MQKLIPLVVPSGDFIEKSIKNFSRKNKLSITDSVTLKWFQQNPQWKLNSSEYLQLSRFSRFQNPVLLIERILVN